MDEPLNTPRVLVVDDWAEMAELIAEALADQGYACLALSSGQEALRVLRSERIDALVTDLRMPEVDGLTLLRASQALDPSRPVILMTAFQSLPSAMEATEQGVCHYLTKPFRLDLLGRLLRDAIGSR